MCVYVHIYINYEILFKGYYNMERMPGKNRRLDLTMNRLLKSRVR